MGAGAGVGADAKCETRNAHAHAHAQVTGGSVIEAWCRENSVRGPWSEVLWRKQQEERKAQQQQKYVEEVDPQEAE
jgi:hypothetical protein